MVARFSSLARGGIDLEAVMVVDAPLACPPSLLAFNACLLGMRGCVPIFMNSNAADSCLLGVWPVFTASCLFLKYDLMTSCSSK